MQKISVMGNCLVAIIGHVPGYAGPEGNHRQLVRVPTDSGSHPMLASPEDEALGWPLLGRIIRDCDMGPLLSLQHFLFRMYGTLTTSNASGTDRDLSISSPCEFAPFFIDHRSRASSCKRRPNQKAVSYTKKPQIIYIY